MYTKSITIRRIVFSSLLILASVAGCGSMACPARADAAPADLNACDGRACKQDSDCPPSLCPTAKTFGTCQNCLCVWK